MKKLALLVVTLAFVSSFAFAEDMMADTAKDTMELEAMPIGAEAMPIEVEIPETMILKGDIIDNMCVGTKTPKEVAELVKTHTKQCALMPGCVASGYSILADGMLQKFDMESNVMIEDFLKKEDSKLQVEVVVKKMGDNLSLVSIKNQM
ncbi:MAG: hypothetical protein ABIA66_04385 [Candidatus Omnitrophota bacterium]